MKCIQNLTLHEGKSCVRRSRAVEAITGFLGARCCSTPALVFRTSQLENKKGSANLIVNLMGDVWVQARGLIVFVLKEQPAEKSC